MLRSVTPGTGSAAPWPRLRTATWSPGRSRARTSWAKLAMIRPPSPRLPRTAPVRAGRGAGPDRDHVADARLGGEGVAGRGVGVDQARAGRGMVADVRPGAVAEADAEDHAAVADRDVRRAVGVDAVRVGADAGLLDHRREIDVTRLPVLSLMRAPPQLRGQHADVGVGVVDQGERLGRAAHDGRRPGPCPNSRQLPVEITPMLVQPSR